MSSVKNSVHKRDCIGLLRIHDSIFGCALVRDDNMDPFGNVGQHLQLLQQQQAVRLDPLLHIWDGVRIHLRNAQRRSHFLQVSVLLLPPVFGEHRGQHRLDYSSRLGTEAQPLLQTGNLFECYTLHVRHFVYGFVLQIFSSQYGLQRQQR